MTGQHPARPHLVVVSPRFLFPLDQGGRIRTANTLRHMKGGAFRITLLSPAPPDAGRWAAETAALCDEFRSWPEAAPGLPAKLAALVGPLPVAVAGDRSAAGHAAVDAALAAGPDAVLIDFPHAAVLAPERLPCPAILFTHNVEAEIFERQVAVTRFPMRAVWQHEARKMRRFEGDVLRRFGTVIAVSRRDAEALERQYALKKVHPVETGVDTGYYAFVPPEDRPPVPDGGGTVVFTGAMDSRSNVEGIQFMLDESWPLLLRRRPGARAVIVGRNPPAALVAAAKARGFDWHFTGFVDDVRPHVAAAHAYAIPLRVGSGTRIKVFEAMAMGCPVVSTALGVEGLDVRPGEHFRQADTAASFADAIADLLDDAGQKNTGQNSTGQESTGQKGTERGGTMAAAARLLVETRFSWPAVTRHFEAVCLGALGRG